MTLRTFPADASAQVVGTARPMPVRPVAAKG